MSARKQFSSLVAFLVYCWIFSWPFCTWCMHTYTIGVTLYTRDKLIEIGLAAYNRPNVLEPTNALNYTGDDLFQSGSAISNGLSNVFESRRIKPTHRGVKAGSRVVRRIRVVTNACTRKVNIHQKHLSLKPLEYVN